MFNALFKGVEGVGVAAGSQISVSVSWQHSTSVWELKGPLHCNLAGGKKKSSQITSSQPWGKNQKWNQNIEPFPPVLFINIIPWHKKQNKTTNHKRNPKTNKQTKKQNPEKIPKQTNHSGMERQLKAVIFNFSGPVLENKPRDKKNYETSPCLPPKRRKLAYTYCSW